ncbi:MAG: hypothetical protein E7523_06805 [Ruminococcaceae bacterium]|nr:hypothetical protein [Oscillospiraceae bacterium]
MKKGKFLHTFCILLAVAVVLLISSISAFAAVGWSAENGALYYYGTDGKKVTGMQMIETQTYEFLPDGRLTGKNVTVATENGVYCINNAAIVKGFKALGDTLHYFGDDGIRFENGTIDGLTVQDGVVQGNNIYVRSGTVRHFLQNNRILFTVSDYDTQLVLTADHTTAGGQTSVRISLKNNPGIAELQLRLHFDCAMLTHTFTYDEGLLAGFSEVKDSNSIILTWSGVADCKNDGTLVTLYFDAGNTQGDTLVHAQTLSAKAANETDRTCSEGAATITIGCPHDFEEYIFNNDSTCTADGTKTATCSHCGATDTVTAYNTKIPHTGGNATCMAKAICEVCGTAYGTYAPDVHLNLVAHEGKEPTCYANGYTAYEQCTDCTKELDKTVLYATNHKNAYSVAAKLPTCTQKGYNDHIYCPDCNRVSGYEELPATGHRNTVTVSALTPTCTEGGYNEYTFCNDCQTALDRTDLPATNHPKKQTIKKKDATCYEDGHSSYTHCPDCNTDFGYEILPMLSHKNKYPVAEKQASCTEDGHTAYEHCPDCGEDFGKEIYLAQGHPSTIEIVAKAPTCTAPGYETYECCTVCMTDIGKVDLPALGHRELTNYTALTATCTADGHTAYSVCGICAEEIGKTVYPALQHKNKYTVGEKEPTCTEDGNNRYIYCPDCNTAFDKETYPATNHANKTFQEGLPPTCTENGYTAHYACSDCGEKTNYEEIPALQHKNATAHPAKDPTCTEPGMSAHISCPDCGMTSGKTEIPPLGHKNKYTVSAVKPTCTETGWTAYEYCPDCGFEEGKEVVPAKGHDFSFWITEVHAGLGKEGTEIRWCGACMETEKRTTAALTLADGNVYQCGDADRNNLITADDARSALRYSVGLDNPSQLKLILADYDGNGEVTAADARLLLRAAVGLEDIGPFFCFVTEDGYYERIEPEDN